MIVLWRTRASSCAASRTDPDGYISRSHPADNSFHAAFLGLPDPIAFTDACFSRSVAGPAFLLSQGEGQGLLLCSTPAGPWLESFPTADELVVWCCASICSRSSDHLVLVVAGAAATQFLVNAQEAGAVGADDLEAVDDLTHGGFLLNLLVEEPVEEGARIDVAHLVCGAREVTDQLGNLFFVAQGGLEGFEWVADLDGRNLDLTQLDSLAAVEKMLGELLGVHALFCCLREHPVAHAGEGESV